MERLKLMDKETTNKYQNYKSTNSKVRSCSLSSRAGKGSVVSGKINYSKKHKELFNKFMEL